MSDGWVGPLKGIVAAAILLGPLGWATGCCLSVDCSPCDESIVVSATDADTGQAIDGRDVACRDAANPIRPCHELSEPGSYRIIVSATGYQSVERVVSVGESSGGCCDCGYHTAYLDVALEPN